MPISQNNIPQYLIRFNIHNNESNLYRRVNITSTGKWSRRALAKYKTSSETFKSGNWKIINIIKNNGKKSFFQYVILKTDCCLQPTRLPKGGLTHLPLGYFNLILGRLTWVNGGWGICYEIALRWMPLNLIDDKSTLVQVMAWCRQATSHYLNRCWPRCMSPNGVTMLQCVKKNRGKLVEQRHQTSQRQSVATLEIRCRKR